MAYKLFLDTNVLLDVFLERTADWNEAETVLQLATQNKIDVFTSANNLVNVIYSLKKQKLTQDEIIKLIELTLTYTQLADITRPAFSFALRAGFPDLEDAVQYHTALRIKGIDYFISSNTRDYKKASSQLPVLTPKQFMVLYNK
ncbi:MAG TPA: PIN domain-containing protein [Chitinophagaceae bacterium]|nr:PIN domain-containing protein [Chitinophagaceae bacterium]